jgi:mono/diheme cytochrome c family protein
MFRLEHAKGLNAVATASKTLILLAILGLGSPAFAGVWDTGDVENGQSLFNANCASCHKVTDEVLAAPGLAGIADRWGASEDLLILWIQDPQAAAESGDPYIKGLVERYVGTYGWMTGQAVSAADVADIMAYVQNPPEGSAGLAAGAGSDCPTIDYNAGSNAPQGTLWFLILLTLFLIVALSAASVKRVLKNAVALKEGHELAEESTYMERVQVWAWDNRVFVGILGVFITAYIVVIGYQGLMGIGVYEAYSPSQPIKFIHSVHVCENEVDCQYCHHSADESKHAGIPSTNVCMNCHKAVKTGSRYGETEIAKIYEAIGFDAATGTYLDGGGKNGYALPQDNFGGDPIAWNKVHNLPDHVFFSHQQHVEVGGLHCQNCHGDVGKFSVGRIAPVEEINALIDDFPGLIQLSKPTLTMGWCIECHNKAEISFASSGYYEEMHDRLRDDLRGNEELRLFMEDGKATVKELGGWECAKCHY